MSLVFDGHAFSSATLYVDIFYVARVTAALHFCRAKIDNDNALSALGVDRCQDLQYRSVPSRRDEQSLREK